MDVHSNHAYNMAMILSSSFCGRWTSSILFHVILETRATRLKTKDTHMISGKHETYLYGMIILRPRSIK